jgi:mannosyl-3-phosphoglycerate phosphatase family protein
MESHVVASPVYLVVTDLDGSLLDHDTYSCKPALPMLEQLDALRIPVVFASSKTRAEILALRAELGNEHPFIVENGAAALIPDRYFTHPPKGCVERDGYWVRDLAPARSTWTTLLDSLRGRFPGAFQDFSTAGVDGIMAMTGLSRDAAARANEREYSEPVQWRGTDAGLDAFLAAVREGGARALRGGRFISIAGDADKGRAWLWLREAYALAAGGAQIYDLGLGDGQNDVPLLEVTRTAAPIPAQGRPLPALERDEGVLLASGLYGPEAWAHSTREWLRGLYGKALGGDGPVGDSTA